MDPSSKSRSATGMSGLVRRVLGAGGRLKRNRSKRVSAAEEQEDYFSSKSKGSSSSSSSTDSCSEMESEADGEDVLSTVKEKKRARRMRPRTFRRQRSYQMWIGNRPRLAFSCLRIRIVHMVRLMKTMTFLRRLRNAYRRLMHAAGSSKVVLSLTDLYYAIADLIPGAQDEKCPPANNIIVLRPITLQSAKERNLILSLRNRADIQALRESLSLPALGSGSLVRTNAALVL